MEGLMLKLKLQYFGHLLGRVNSLEKTLMLGGIGGRREKGTTEDEMAGWHHQLNGREFGWIKTIKIYSLSNLKVYNAVLLTIITMLCIQSELIYLVVANLYP